MPINKLIDLAGPFLKKTLRKKSWSKDDLDVAIKLAEENKKKEEERSSLIMGVGGRALTGLPVKPEEMNYFLSMNDPAEALDLFFRSCEYLEFVDNKFKLKHEKWFRFSEKEFLIFIFICVCIIAWFSWGKFYFWFCAPVVVYIWVLVNDFSSFKDAKKLVNMKPQLKPREDSSPVESTTAKLTIPPGETPASRLIGAAKEPIRKK